MIWTFLLIMSFGIGNLVGVLALLISTCGFLIRSFIRPSMKWEEKAWKPWRQWGPKRPPSPR